MPEWALPENRPAMPSESDQIFVNAYVAGDTCRSIGLEAGPIPYVAVSAWCRDMGVLDLLRDVWFVVNRADMIVMRDRAEKMKAEQEGRDRGRVKNPG